MRFNKKMSKGGSITIPAALRRELGIGPGEKFSIGVNENGSLTLARTQGSCIFCKAEDNLVTYHGRFVCRSCTEKLHSEKGSA
ncbi:AbrB/MazE/SpoVT family DNA-binding domain-containing protein [Schinkia azotoformans]|uniref:AbrB/MazE/SpoVT family DNA-binding domain-containing protein n=1 Tax=Schinkia azotoformans TaxID=1454 RepID=UPI002E205748|nr:AbrB/MazE/SpoVT family DNA-binding domain-containing protein [Schinkia azotoformans]